MRPLWLLLDGNYLCWRSYHVVGDLQHNGLPTGVVFGYFKTILDLQEQFVTSRVVHCFDHGRSKRYEVYPEYKASRQSKRDLSKEEEQSHLRVRNQIIRLRRDYLPVIGCKNIFSCSGYEGDDILASICKGLPEDQEAVIIGSDHDLFQLLTDRISMYNPKEKKTITVDSFRKEWGVEPEDWARVMSISGCGSDGIKGIDGVGEKTAAKFLRGELKFSTKAYKEITSNPQVMERNKSLVTLPFDGCPTFTLQDDKLDREGWERICDELGMKSIRNLRRLLPFNVNF
jgi:DNA polymerase-1